MKNNTGENENCNKNSADFESKPAILFSIKLPKLLKWWQMEDMAS
jgi:hypothetical protein